jgi:S1-C subfamily serine protease
MPRVLFAVALCLVSLRPVWALDLVSYQQDGSRKAAARIKNWQEGYHKVPYVAGSGTLVAIHKDRGLVLTAGHLFKDKVGPITVEFPDGQVSGARLVSVDHQLDVAALWIFAPKGIDPIPVAGSDPKLNDQVEIWGYGPKRFRAFVAKVTKPIAAAGDVPNSLIGAQGLEQKVTIPGDSGGPMIQDGKLVGVHWGYRGAEDDDRRCVHAVGAHRLRSWIAARLGKTVCEECSPQAGT